MRPVVVSLLLSALLAPSPALAGSWVVHGDSAPVGLTASLDGVPTLDPISLPTPYRAGWEKSVQAFQLAFQAKLEAQIPMANIDPIETGSISAAR